MIDSRSGDISRVTNSRLASFLTTAGIIVAGIILVILFREPINAFGVDLMIRYGQQLAGADTSPLPPDFDAHLAAIGYR